jgi:glutamyl-tRNA reductase
MNLVLVSANHRTATMPVRERLAFRKDDLPKAVAALAQRLGGEAAILNTCNRVELYAVPGQDLPLPSGEALVRFLAEQHGLPADDVRHAVACLEGPPALRHLFRVAASLDSVVLGEVQIAGQVKAAYELGQQLGTVGPVLHAVFQHARQVAKRVHRETGLTQGKVSVASLAIDYLRQVFDHFTDKTVLIIGAGKIGALTLRQLAGLHPKAVLLTNRNADRAAEMAATCGGRVVPWSDLDAALVQADIVVSTTGAPEPIVTWPRFKKLLPARRGRHVAIIDLAVPRDFAAEIATCDEVDLLVNVDDFKALRERVLGERCRHVAAAEAIVDAELERFQKEWSRRWTGPAIARLGQTWDAIRRDVETDCLAKLSGKLSEADRAVVTGALRLLQNKLMHAPLAVLQEEARAGRGRNLLDAILQLFRLG